MAAGYFYFTAHHRHRKDLDRENYGPRLIGRVLRPLIAIRQKPKNTPIPPFKNFKFTVPVLLSVTPPRTGQPGGFRA